jgi:hypothetical protein
MKGSVGKPESRGGPVRNPYHKAMFGFFDHTTPSHDLVAITISP